MGVSWSATLSVADKSRGDAENGAPCREGAQVNSGRTIKNPDGDEGSGRRNESPWADGGEPTSNRICFTKSCPCYPSKPPVFGWLTTSEQPVPRPAPANQTTEGRRQHCSDARATKTTVAIFSWPLARDRSRSRATTPTAANDRKEAARRHPARRCSQAGQDQPQSMLRQPALASSTPASSPRTTAVHRAALARVWTSLDLFRSRQPGNLRLRGRSPRGTVRRRRRFSR